jgi:hypothetical protein
MHDFSRHLDPGERLLWTGQPPRGILFRREDAFVIPFSIVWLAFAVFWEASVLGFVKNESGPIPFLAVFGAFFVAFGIFFVIGRFPWDAYVRHHTDYALTDRRAIIRQRGVFPSVRSIAVTAATPVSTDELGDGTGTIHFGPRLTLFGITGWQGHGYEAFTFERVPNCREVLRAIRKAQEGSK